MHSLPIHSPVLIRPRASVNAPDAALVAPCLARPPYPRQAVTERHWSPSPSSTHAPHDTWGRPPGGVYVPSPSTAPAPALRRAASIASSPWSGGLTPRSGVGVSPASQLPPPTPVDTAPGPAGFGEASRHAVNSGVSGPGVGASRGGERREESGASLRELHVFCRAVRVSMVDGEFGEMVLGSLEEMSMSVAATAREVDVKFQLGSLQVDSHMPGYVRALHLAWSAVDILCSVRLRSESPDHNSTVSMPCATSRRTCDVSCSSSCHVGCYVSCHASCCLEVANGP